MRKIKKIVIAFGGNVLQSGTGPATAAAQLEVLKYTCKYIADISNNGYEMAIVHGNGLQIGRILLATESSRNLTPVMPFDVCGAMSQGYIGYHIQQALSFALKKIDRHVPVVTLTTQVVVDYHDKGFQNPSKPIGTFYSKEEAEAIVLETGYVMKEDSGRGYRRVVASPIPIDIIEIDAVQKLWDTTIVVTCGGGGIPVIRNDDGSLEGVAAVIDKDYTAGLLAEKIDAEILMILTEVEKVYINFNKPDQQALSEVTVAEAEKYIAKGHFAPGSMLPKINAAVKFVKGRPGKTAIITSLDKAVEALAGKTGTSIRA